MFKDDVLAKIYAHPHMKEIPICAQMEIIGVFEESLREYAEEFPYVYLQHIFEEDTHEL